MENHDYVSYIKELILHHCLRCGILSESSTCDICKREISGDPVMVKVEVKITASNVEAHVSDLLGDFRHIKPGHLRWVPSHGTTEKRDDVVELRRRLIYEAGDVD